MANRRRGEIEARLAGKPHILCLTLGALAELETAFGKADLIELAERFSQGRLSAQETLTVLHLGLKGGGHELAREDVARMTIDGGAAGAVRIVSELLAATFGADAPIEGDAPHPQQARETIKSPAPPFPGAR